VLERPGREPVVLRVSAASQWGLGPREQLARELATLRAVAPTGVGPAPHGWLGEPEDEPPVLIEEWVDGRRFDAATDLEALARAVAAIHAPEVAAAAGHLPRSDARAALLADGHAWLDRARVGGGDPEAVALLDAHAATLPDGVPAEPEVLVHSDLNAGNLVVQGDRCRLLDWEAARLGAPGWDLAHAVAPSTTEWDDAAPRTLSARERAGFLDAYARAAGRDREEVAEAVAAWSPVVGFRALSWCAGAAAQARAEGTRLEPALADRLERFRRPTFVAACLRV